MNDASEYLEGLELDDAVLEETAQVASDAAEPISDLRASAQYRRELVGVLTKNALRAALQRARE